MKWLRAKEGLNRVTTYIIVTEDERDTTVYGAKVGRAVGRDEGEGVGAGNGYEVGRAVGRVGCGVGTWCEGVDERAG